MLKPFGVLVFSLITSSVLNAQNLSISGIFKDSIDHESLIGVNVILTHENDSLDQSYAVTDLEGRFELKGISSGIYNIKASYIGYADYSVTIRVEDKPIALGSLFLAQKVQMMNELVIRGEVAPAMQMGDTTQFNAGAFKTAPFASSKDLVEKMPGITVQDGKVQAQGEQVQQILVDGKPFFGKDVNAALQNLPAEIIASIQIFDKKSEKAELSGFDDGERIKTINIVTKPNRKKGQFGKTSAGYGTNDRYQAGASVNFFNNDRRFTVTGMTNNINTLSYSADAGDNGNSQTQNGLIKTNSIGFNFSDEWNDNLKVSASYTFLNRDNSGSHTRFRDYLLPSDSGRIYQEDSHNTHSYANHYLNLRIDYDINDHNRLLIIPSAALRHNRRNGYLFGYTTTDNGPLNETENTSASRDYDYDFDNRIYYSHKFKKEGRNLLLHLSTGYYDNELSGSRVADNTYFKAVDDSKDLDQESQLDRSAVSWRALTSYTEPIGENGKIELEYSVSNKVDDSDKLTYNVDEALYDYPSLDTALSNTFKSEALNHEMELGYQYRTEKLRIQAEAEYQQVALHNIQEFPQPFDIKKTYESWLPSARLVYEFSKASFLELNYRTNTNTPSIGQLQNVIDNSNPLHLRTGNSNLEQAYNNWGRIRYKLYRPETHKTIYASVSASFWNNLITNSTFIADEPTRLNDDIILEKGSQLSSLVNQDGYYSIYSYLSYSQPVDFIKSNFNVNGAFSYTKRPGMINHETNFTYSNNFRLGISLSSNISEKVDFNISTRASYYVVENTIQPALDNSYLNQSTHFRGSFIFWKDFVYRTSLNHQYNSGVAEGYDNSFFLWNMSLGKKFLKSKQAELSVNVYDLLGENNNISRNITELYIEDRQSAVLQKYFMVSLTYNIRHFSQGADMDDFKEHY